MGTRPEHERQGHFGRGVSAIVMPRWLRHEPMVGTLALCLENRATGPARAAHEPGAMAGTRGRPSSPKPRQRPRLAQ
jgi:hypothetical protein